MLWLWWILFMAICLTCLRWLFTPSGQAFAKRVEIENQKQQEQRLKNKPVFNTSSIKRKKSKPINSGAEISKAFKSITSLIDPKRTAKLNKRIRNTMGGNPSRRSKRY